MSLNRRGTYALGSLLGVWLLAALGAELLYRAAGLGALGPNPDAAGHLALTFDDGPSQRTPALLSLLAAAGAKATFFVTPDACAAFPAELRAIIATGHQVEAHGLRHRHALSLWPWQEWAQVRWHPRSGEVGPLLYRPPYGGHSPLTRLLARLAGRQVTLWDVESRDWTDQRAEQLLTQVLPQLISGSVILLHDGPAVTPELLKLLLPQLQARQLKAVTLVVLPAQRIGWRLGWRRLRGSYGLA